VAGETLSFDIFARLREDGFAKAGKAASAATDDVMALARRLDELSKKSATARVDLAGDKEALAQLDKLDLKLLTTGRRVVDPKITLDGAAKAQAEIAGLEISLTKLGATSADTTASVGSGAGGLAGPAGMGALIGAGVALAPVMATVAVGVGGFGAAAAGAVAPIVKAAGATGGLAANMAALDPEQRKLAKSVLVLQDEYHAFSKSLEPQVLDVFGTGIRTAGHLMHDMQPIAAAAGKALDSMLGAIDAEFQSGTWQDFFAFMGRTAGPDIALITNNFTDLMKILPGLLQDLQPVATGFLQLTDDVLKLAGAIIKISDAERSLASSAHHSSGFLGELAHAAEHAVGQFLPGIPAAQKLGQAIAGQADASSKAGSGLHSVGTEAAAAQQPVFNLTAAVTGLTDAMQKNIGTVLTLQGDEIGWQQALRAASKQLDSNSAGLRGNSKDALANKAAVLQATQGAVSFAENQLKLGNDLTGASRNIQAQIHWLQVHAGKSKFARDEIHALRMEENKLLGTIRQRLLVSASGFWKVTGAISGGTPQAGGGPVQAARGMYISQGREGVDDQLIMAQRGELIVPVPLVKAGLADHLRGLIPGFAEGGVIGSYSGGVSGAAKWLGKEDRLTLHAVEAATAAATAAGIKSAQLQANAGGFGIGKGGSQAIAKYAASYGTGQNHPYVWGGNSPSGWDCSGFTSWVYHHFGYSPPRTSQTQQMWAKPSKDTPGALVFFYGTGGTASHVGISLGGGGYVGADSPAVGTVIHGSAGNSGFGVPPSGFAQGGVVGGTKHKKPPDPQQKRWLAQLAGDVKRLEADQKHAAHRRRVLNRALAIDELWFLTHPHVEKGGIGWNEHEKALSRDRRLLRHFNKTESEKEAVLEKKIALLRLLTHHPRGRKYGGPGAPAPDPGAGDGSGDGGGDTGGGTTPAPSGPPPIPPPPMPAWMVSAGLGGGAPSGGFSFPSPVSAPPSFGGGMGWPEPVTPWSWGGGGRSMGWGGGGDLGDLIAAIQAMHQGVVGAVGRVAPGMSRGVDQSLNSMAARVSGRFS